MFKFKLPRLPFREDSFFSILFLMVLCIPLVFTIYTRENFETVKYSLWLVFTGVLLMVFVRTSSAAPLEARINKAAGQNIGESKKDHNGLIQSLPLTGLIFLGLFVLWAIASSFFSPDKLNSFFGFYYRFSSSVLFYAVLAIFVLALGFLKSREYISVLLKVLVFDAGLVAIVAILQSQGFAFYEGLNSAGFQKAPSLLGNPIFSSMFLAMVLPFIFYFWHRSRSFAGKIYYGLSAFFCFAAIIILTSRGAWAAIVASFLVFILLLLLYSKKRKFLLLGLAGFLIIGTMAALFLNVYKAQGGRVVFSFSEENITTRLFAWEMAREAITERPLVGVGLGNFQQFFEQNRGKYLSSASQVFDDPHNLFLQMPAAGGLPLVVFFLCLISTAIWQGILLFKKEENFLALAGICSVVVFLAAAAFTPVAIPCFLALAVVLVSLLRGEGKIALARPSLWLKIPLLVLAVCFLYSGIALITAEHLFYRATFAYGAYDLPAASKLTGWAIKLNPTNQLYYLYDIGINILKNPRDKQIENEKQTLLAMHPKAANSYSMLATLNFLSFVTTKQNDFFEKAASAMKHSLAIDPYAATRHLRLGYFYLFSGRVEMAQASTEMSLRMDNKLLPGWLQMAKIYQIEGKKPQAIYALEQAFRLRPDLLELKSLLLAAKAAKDIKSMPINLPADLGRLE